jgi:hypothetical protein
MNSRFAALGGFVFAVCSVVGGVAMPKPPSPRASAGTVHGYFAGHHDALLAGSTLAALAAVALLPFLAALRSRLHSSRLAADTVAAAGSALVASAVLGAVVQAGVVHVASRLDGSSLLVAYGIERAIFYIAPPFLVVALGASVALAGALPGWLRALSGLLSVVAAVAAVASVLATSSAGTAIGLAGFGLTIVWAVCASVELIRTPAAVPLREPVAVLA